MKIFKKILFGFILFFLFPKGTNWYLGTAVLAQGGRELTFEVKDKDWDYAAKIMPPELIEQVRKENLDEYWIGDPKKFQVFKVQPFGQQYPFYFVYPVMPCPEDGCKTQALWDMYHPTCNSFGGCGFFAYIEETPGVYRRVFRQQFWIGTKKNDPFFKITRQLSQGYPACFELTGYDGEIRERGVPQKREDQVYVSRYCYDGQNYVLQNLYVTQSQAR